MSNHPIPEAALKKHIAILGMNGSGKTSVAKSQIIEPALAAGKRVCVIDPTGVGWGLRLSRNGKGKGFPIYIVGGEHADFPLFRRDGKAWAEIVGTSSDSFVFDTSAMTVEDRSQWFTDFAETLIRKNKGPLILVIDEAHLFAPQGGAKVGGIAPRMLHATNNLLALGRSRGLRITMISQRPAKLHKDSLTQAHTLIAMALMAPQDRAAVKDWIADQADAERGKEIIASLPSFEPGEGWIWAPKEKVLERVKFSRPKTFDSSSAPDDADSGAVELSPVDPAAITEKLAAVAKETVANDVPTLKASLAARDREIAELKRASSAAPVSDPAAVAQAETRGFERGKAAAMAAAEKSLRTGMQDFLSALRKPLSAVDDFIAGGEAEARKMSMPEVKFVPSTNGAAAPKAAAKPAPRLAMVRAADGAAVSLPPGERAILTAAAQYGGVDRDQLSVLTGYKRSSRDAYIQRLREKGYVELSGQTVAPTQAGVDALGDYDPLPVGVALQDYWRARLPEGERKILFEVIGVYPESMPRADLDEVTGYKRSSRDAYIQRLKARRLLSVEGSTLRAVPALF